MALIDRNLPTARSRPERPQLSAVSIFATLLVAVLVLSAIAALVAQIAGNEDSRSAVTLPKTPADVLYVTHNPIRIVGNADFTTWNGVLGGSGAPSNPYIIANWDISAQFVDGISIQDTDAYFVVRNCYVHDGWRGTSLYYYFGIHVSNCTNCILDNNTCGNNAIGIYLDSSSHGNTLIGNNCSSSHYAGIALSLSDNNTIINNTCCRNQYFDGIDLGRSSNNTIKNNNCSSNAGFGISLWLSKNNTVIYNHCSSNYFHGVYLDQSRDNTVSSNICNSNGHWGVFVYQSNDNTIVNNTCDLNAYNGIHLSSSSSNDLTNNSCSGNDIGIYLQSSSNGNEIFNNQILHNVGFGVYIYSGSSNRVWNNTFIDNNGATSTYSSLHVQAFDSGINNRWNSTLGYGNYWGDWLTPDIAPPEGIVDLPYNISGTAGANDSYPLTTPQAPIPEFGMVPFVVMGLLAVMVLSGRKRRDKDS